MRVLEQLLLTLRTIAKARRHRLDLLRHLVRRPQILAATGAYEVGVMASARVEARLKVLAELKVAAIVSCEYCLDIGAALARGSGITEDQLRRLHEYRTSGAFDATERLVLELAEQMTRSPALVAEDVRARLEDTLGAAGLTELAAVIAWENQRARLNQALGIRPSGFSDGEICPRPEPALAGSGSVVTER